MFRVYIVCQSACTDTCTFWLHLQKNSSNNFRHPNWAAVWLNQQNGMCAKRRLRSVWASAQFLSKSSLCADWIAKDPMCLRLWSDLADLSLRWARRSFCWFWHVQAQVLGFIQLITKEKHFTLEARKLSFILFRKTLKFIWAGPWENVSYVICD